MPEEDKSLTEPELTPEEEDNSSTEFMINVRQTGAEEASEEIDKLKK